MAQLGENNIKNRSQYQRDLLNNIVESKQASHLKLFAKLIKSVFVCGILFIVLRGLLKFPLCTASKVYTDNNYLIAPKSEQFYFCF